MRQLGIDCLSIFGLPPVPFVHLAADLGCDFITLGMPVTCNPENYPPYTLTDPALLRDLKTAFSDRGIALQTGESFFVLPGKEVSGYAPMLDAMAELGARCLNTVIVDPDRQRSLDQVAELADMAAARGLATSLEFVAGTPIGTLAAGVETLGRLGRPDMKLVVDTMHFGRSGGTPADLLAVDPALIGYIQISDCRIEPVDRVHEQMYERMCPGDGELALREMLAALPHEVPVGVEIPQRSLAEAGVGPKERLAPCLAATRALLAGLDVNRP